jgi:REP element-mobilizing transposase RayT
VKKELWGGSFWTSGYYVNTVGYYDNAEVIKKYVENQDQKYQQLYVDQLKLW